MPGRSRGAKLARDAPRRGRAAASVQCARAAARVCVPAFPFLPRQSSGQTEQRAAAEKPQQPERSAARRGLRAARSGGSGGRGRRSSGAPGLGLGRGSRRRARLSRSEAQREQSARRLPRLGEAAGPARRPPRLFPFSLHPLAPSPLALQGSQTGLQLQRRRRRRSRGMGTRGMGTRRAGLGRAPRFGRFLLDARVSRGRPGGSEVLQPR